MLVHRLDKIFGLIASQKKEYTSAADWQLSPQTIVMLRWNDCQTSPLTIPSIACLSGPFLAFFELRQFTAHFGRSGSHAEADIWKMA